MKILYGVTGEGMGHAIRSRVILEHLMGHGHEVEIMVSGRAADFLSKHFADVNKIHGLHLIAEDNRVRRGKTLWSNFLAGLTGVPQNIAAYFQLIEEFEPEVVISDFESWTYCYAKAHHLPILSVDNMQAINRCEHAPEILAGEQIEFELVKAFVKSKLPYCDHYIVSSFARPRVRKPDTTLVPPILRQEILDAQVCEGNHVLVYQSGRSFDEPLEQLAALGIECRVYGANREISEVGCLKFRPFSERGFIDDLCSAKAVVASAGFTLMGEAIYLAKPMLAIPIDNQFEQLLNGRYLEQEGYGRTVENSEELGQILGEFLAEISTHQKRVSEYRQNGNVELKRVVDEQLGLLRRG